MASSSLQAEVLELTSRRASACIPLVIPTNAHQLCLKDYQQAGAQWCLEQLARGINVILADEMGLGKTFQALVVISSILAHKTRGPVLVVSPLSVLDNWAQELDRFFPMCRVARYAGDKAQREQVEAETRTFVMSQSKNARRTDPLPPWDLVLTTYEYATQGAGFLSRFQYRALVVDEAHRLKNTESILHKALLEDYRVEHKLLLTGTPCQNRLQELHGLLHFLHPSLFADVDSFMGALGSEDQAPQLRQVLASFLLRREKSQVSLKLPRKTVYTLHCPLTAMQRKYYRLVLEKNASKLGTRNATSLTHIVSGLRKACNHPYLFSGAEPEPFTAGDHIFLNSGKLRVLDKLLRAFKAEGRRVLLFSQSLGTLDILQDYLALRNYSTERLDGSVRGSDRFESIETFSSTDVFCFLLSTRAGGVGLNLTMADTVIFVDADWNPQIDLQAEARVHRLGQTRDVIVVKLVAPDTIEQVIEWRSRAKLRLAHRVLHGAEEAGEDGDESGRKDLREAITFGVDRLYGNKREEEEEEEEEEEVSDAWVAAVAKGRPIEGAASTITRQEKEEDGGKEEEEEEEEEEPSIYYFQGQDLKQEIEARRAASEKLLYGLATAAVEAVAGDVDEGSEGARKRRGRGAVRTVVAVAKKRQRATAEEAAARRLERQERHQAAVQQRRVAAGYISGRLGQDAKTHAEEEEEEDEEEEDEEEGDGYIQHIVGDASKPSVVQGTKVIVNAVNDSGKWSTRGFFRALNAISSTIGEAYCLSKEMEDLRMGDAHLVADVAPDTHVVNVCCLDSRGAVDMASLDAVLRAVAVYCKQQSQVSVHFPRIGDGSAFYAIERYIKKILHGVRTYIYYYQRPSPSPAARPLSLPPRLQQEKKEQWTLPSSFEGLLFHFDPCIDEDTQRTAKRRIYALAGEVADPEDSDSHNDSDSDSDSDGERKEIVITDQRICSTPELFKKVCPSVYGASLPTRSLASVLGGDDKKTTLLRFPPFLNGWLIYLHLVDKTDRQQRILQQLLYQFGATVSTAIAADITCVVSDVRCVDDRIRHVRSVAGYNLKYVVTAEWVHAFICLALAQKQQQSPPVVDTNKLKNLEVRLR